MFKNLTNTLTADCDVIKFSDEQYFYPIFKNGRSSLTIYAGRNNLSLLKNKQISLFQGVFEIYCKIFS